MNERIKELILNAGWQNAYTNPKEGFEVVFKDEDHNLACIKKFAELIVKECVKICDEVHRDYGMAPDTARISKRYIKEHFGVTE